MDVRTDRHTNIQTAIQDLAIKSPRRTLKRDWHQKLGLILLYQACPFFSRHFNFHEFSDDGVRHDPIHSDGWGQVRPVHIVEYLQLKPLIPRIFLQRNLDFMTSY